ncbi:hypothetical protein GB937_004089 [Aspergillus fischeri]|nr:hypothetical protein GB937_004089 [Aspergillus fischeri]
MTPTIDDKLRLLALHGMRGGHFGDILCLGYTQLLEFETRPAKKSWEAGDDRELSSASTLEVSEICELIVADDQEFFEIFEVNDRNGPGKDVTIQRILEHPALIQSLL